MQKNNLIDKIFGYNELNIQNIIGHIKSNYDFNKCGNYNSTINKLDELIKENELSTIINKNELYVDIDTDIVNNVYNIIINIISNYKLLYIHTKLEEQIKLSINKSHGVIMKPSNFKI